MLFIEKASSVTCVNLVLLLGLLLGGCSNISTGAHFDEMADMSGYKTFSWIDKEPVIDNPGSDPADSQLLNTFVTRALQASLEAKGYEFTRDRSQADFIVGYVIGSRDRISANSYPQSYRGYWGWHVYGPYGGVDRVEHRMYTQGTLSIDIFDGKSKAPVWHGWATKTISNRDREAPGEPIRDAVAQVFEKFPPT